MKTGMRDGETSGQENRTRWIARVGLIELALLLSGCTSLQAMYSNDQDTLARIAIHSGDGYARSTAAGRLTNQTLIGKVALESRWDEIRSTCVSKLIAFDDQSLLMDLAMKSQDEKVRLRAVKGLADQISLVALATGGGDRAVRLAAAHQLRDSSMRETAALQADDPAVLKILLAGISDANSLGRIAAQAANRAMRLAAARKAGLRTWEEIFTVAIITDCDLNDACEAVKVLDNKDDYAFAFVWQACRNLINEGDKSHIPRLVELLERYGNTSQAEFYLNCGQLDLNAAGRAWAHKRGYDIEWRSK